MIKTFADKETEKLFNDIRSKRFGSIERQARLKLMALNIAEALTDLQPPNAPPAMRLEKLKGDRAGQWSIRINKQWRVCFNWQDGQGAFDVEIVDYH